MRSNSLRRIRGQIGGKKNLTVLREQTEDDESMGEDHIVLLEEKHRALNQELDGGRLQNLDDAGRGQEMAVGEDQLAMEAGVGGEGEGGASHLVEERADEDPGRRSRGRSRQSSRSRSGLEQAKVHRRELGSEGWVLEVSVAEEGLEGEGGPEEVVEGGLGDGRGGAGEEEEEEIEPLVDLGVGGGEGEEVGGEGEEDELEAGGED